MYIYIDICSYTNIIWKKDLLLKKKCHITPSQEKN